MKTVAILGSGPAGLMAAHATGLVGRPFSIHTRVEKSVLGGAQYLHTPIPYLTSREPDRILTNRLIGSGEDYRDKVYGRDPSLAPDTASAMSVVDGEKVPVWDLNAVYDNLWDSFSDSMNPATIDARWIEEHGNEFDLIISSIPAPALCRRPDLHRFIYQEVWIKPGPASFIPENEVHYNGDKSPAWYRASNIGGTAGGVEWSTEGPQPPEAGLVRVKKPLRHTCTCWPEILRVGRYGTWTKGVLTHDAYYETGQYLLGVTKDPDLTRTTAKTGESFL